MFDLTLSLSQNELKRLQNKHNALERRLQKAQNDLAKAKCVKRLPVQAGFVG